MKGVSPSDWLVGVWLRSNLDISQNNVEDPADMQARDRGLWRGWAERGREQGSEWRIRHLTLGTYMYYEDMRAETNRTRSQMGDITDGRYHRWAISQMGDIALQACESSLIPLP